MYICVYRHTPLVPNPEKTKPPNFHGVSHCLGVYRMGVMFCITEQSCSIEKKKTQPSNYENYELCRKIFRICLTGKTIYSERFLIWTVYETVTLS